MEITKVLKKLNLPANGSYEDKLYKLPLEDSDQYAKMYTLLDEQTVNLENPTIDSNTVGNTTKIINYFEFDFENNIYQIALVADFTNDKYFIQIGKKDDI